MRTRRAARPDVAEFGLRLQCEKATTLAWTAPMPLHACASDNAEAAMQQTNTLQQGIEDLPDTDCARLAAFAP